MTAADHRCECCGNIDPKGAVASSGMAPMSLFWCRLCLAMGAEPALNYEIIFDTVPHEKARGTYYVSMDDTYRSARTGEIVPIPFKDGTECRTMNT